MAERKSGRPNDLVSYAGGSVSSWKGHPCQTGEKVGARRNVVPSPSGEGVGCGANDSTVGKICCYETSRE
jgi:hypothetical protein